MLPSLAFRAFEELLDTVRRDALDRVPALVLEMTGVVAHDGLPLGLGHRVNAAPQALGQGELFLASRAAAPAKPAVAREAPRRISLSQRN